MTFSQNALRHLAQAAQVVKIIFRPAESRSSASVLRRDAVPRAYLPLWTLIWGLEHQSDPPARQRFDNLR